MSVMRTKSVEQSIADTDEPEYKLKKTLTALDLTVFGVGVIIGAGIFTLTGRAAAPWPVRRSCSASSISAVCCGLAALCYAEFASIGPGVGLGVHVLLREPGRDHRLDHRLGPAAGADARRQRGRAGLERVRGGLPRQARHPLAREPSVPGGSVDLLAMLLVAVLATLVTIGIKESMRVNLVLVGVKLFIVLFVIIAGIGFINPANYNPFIPPAACRSAPTWPGSTAADPGRDRAGSRARTASVASSPARPWSSSPTSVSTWWPPPRRRPRTRSGTCRSASSPRW